jgi:hypothetical protein
MAQTTGSTSVPIDHYPAVHEIEPEAEGPIRPLTLMEIVDAVGQVAETEAEVLATVTFMLRSGRIQLATGDDVADLAEVAG